MLENLKNQVISTKNKAVTWFNGLPMVGKIAVVGGAVALVAYGLGAFKKKPSKKEG